MEGDLAPCPRAARRMAAFDALPAEMRRFVASYDREITNRQARDMLIECNGDVTEAIEAIRAALPVWRNR